VTFEAAARGFSVGDGGGGNFADQGVFSIAACQAMRYDHKKVTKIREAIDGQPKCQ
jgi:hypothetical protein